MINCIKKSLEIDMAYSVNSFIYILKKIPILKDLITDDIYGDKEIKKIISLIWNVFNFLKLFALKFLYFFVIFFLSYKLNKNNFIKSFFHVYFVFSIIGLFVNNKLLDTNKKKYFSLILFNMDSTKYYKASILWNQIINIFYNTIMAIFFGSLIYSPKKYIILLIVLPIFTRFTGEALNIIFYKKNNYIWYSNSKLYFPIVLSLFAFSLAPYINIILPLSIILKMTILIILLGIVSLMYLLSVKDYRLMYKRLSNVVNVMDHKNEKDYLKQAMVEVKGKDKKINPKKLEGKKGYDYFNIIFFERHKEILLRSAKKYSIILIGIYIFLSYMIYHKNGYYNKINDFLINKLGWFGIIMFIINRGAIITQAMFYNCDHAMLKYNFYREPKAILELFKKRLLTVIKVNLLPATIVGIGNVALLLQTDTSDVMTLIMIFMFIISLSIFFSVHYLVIYYLFQPFNKEMEVKKASYSFATLITYIVTYTLTKLTISPIMLSTIGIIFTIVYIVVSLSLVYKYASITFKLN